MPKIDLGIAEIELKNSEKCTGCDSIDYDYCYLFGCGLLPANGAGSEFYRCKFCLVAENKQVKK